MRRIVNGSVKYWAVQYVGLETVLGSGGSEWFRWNEAVEHDLERVR